MVNNDKYLDLKKLLTRIRTLRQRLKLTLHTVELNSVRLDGLLQDTLELEKFLMAELGETPPMSRSMPAPAANDTLLLEDTAKNGAEEITFSWLPNGNALVRIDRQKDLQFSEALGTLLEILAADSWNKDDLLVGWKSRVHVLTELEERLDRTFSGHALDELMCRLRKRMTICGTNRFLVQTRKNVGIRFAVLRKETCDEQ